ncbi:FHA domain-containing protein [Microbacterium sp. ru370.1]|uniref:FHA domain-containing protein FhaB/FipA n=1 Tax=unclassified Microbacterium TaxID=2609290 RepID=UPI000888B5DA|nr:MULTISPECIES: FHA domain-containing protein [unclassified Microbacterium]SDO34622.1 FHA domain-containing protein [Microbacterium sp. ru370.1]SIT77476.1 Inner membrane component of T3SS domain-containing protein [Microbacterium sp. RU1D]
MSQLTLLLLQGGFLVLLWFFVFGVVYSLRADLFGVKVRKLPEPAASAPAAAAPTASPDAVTTQVKRPAAPPAPAPVGALATTSAVSRIVITSGPKAGLELPLGTEPLTIGRSSESGLVIRDDYTSSHHARLVLWGDQWMLQDLDSTNGTTHDGVRVASPVQVKVGAPIKVGATTFELRT